MGDHHLLAQQPGEIAVGLEHGCAAVLGQPGLCLAHDAGQKRGERDHERHLRELHEQIEDHDHAASTRSKETRAPKTSAR